MNEDSAGATVGRASVADGQARNRSGGSQAVWYSSYGSNMSAKRFGCYLYGGTPEGGSRQHPGCRDQRPPAEDRAVELPGGVYFAGESSVWTGGVAYYDAALPGSSPARAYLITREQFADVTAQESHRSPGGQLDIDTLVRNGRLQLGEGGYETLLCLGELDGNPLVTFTAPHRRDEIVPTVPSAAYLRTLAEGLLESRPWTARQAAGYLAELPGAAGAWSQTRILALLGDAA